MGSGLKITVKMKSANQIIKDHGLDENGRVTRFLRDDVYRLYEPYVPRDNGNLYRQVTYPNNHSIKHIVPYADYMYKGKKAEGASKPKGVKRKITNNTIENRNKSNSFIQKFKIKSLLLFDIEENVKDIIENQH